MNHGQYIGTPRGHFKASLPTAIDVDSEEKLQTLFEIRSCGVDQGCGLAVVSCSDIVVESNFVSMQPFPFSAFPRNRTAQAAFVTVLYSVLALFALYAPIDSNAPFVKLFGSQSLARQAMTEFVQCLFWPLIAILAVTALRGCYDSYARKRTRM